MHANLKSSALLFLRLHSIFSVKWSMTLKESMALIKLACIFIRGKNLEKKFKPSFLILGWKKQDSINTGENRKIKSIETILISPT